MAETLKSWLPRVGLLCRSAAVAVIAGVFRRQSIGEINDRLRSRPLGDQVAITGGVLALLFLLSLAAAHFGWIGMLAFWLAVIVLVN
jgi:hypothetical protein